MTSLLSKRWIIEMLKVYQNNPCLWDRRHPDYKNRLICNKAYEYLLMIYRKVDENATRDTLRKKLQNLKTGFYKELRKVNMSKLTATRLEDIYVPTLWYFGSLSFLATECEYSPDNCTIEIEDSDESMDHETNERTERNENQEPETSSPLPKKIKEEKVEDIQPKVEITPVEQKPSVQIKEEEWDILGKSIAIQLRDIISKKQFVITQKLISDAIYYAKMGLLSESSQISLEAAHPKTPQHEMPSTSSHRI